MAGPLAISGAWVGRVVAQRETCVTFRDSAAYAAAIGADRDIYMDDRVPGGAVAPPAFSTALEWPLLSSPEMLDAIGLAHDDLFSTLLHAFQDTTFHQPLRVGQQLRIDAVIVSVKQTRTGVITTTRLTTRAIPTGECVATSLFGAFYRGAVAHHPGRHDPAPPPGSSPHMGVETAIPLQPFTRAQAHIYAECARLWNPIHTEPGFAAALGLPAIALHGTLLWAIAAERMIDAFGHGKPAALRRLALRFTRPIHPGVVMTMQVGHLSREGRSIRIEDSASHALADGIAASSRMVVA